MATINKRLLFILLWGLVGILSACSSDKNTKEEEVVDTGRDAKPDANTSANGCTGDALDIFGKPKRRKAPDRSRDQKTDTEEMVPAIGTREEGGIELERVEQRPDRADSYGRNGHNGIKNDSPIILFPIRPTSPLRVTIPGRACLWYGRMPALF